VDPGSGVRGLGIGSQTAVAVIDSGYRTPKTTKQLHAQTQSPQNPRAEPKLRARILAKSSPRAQRYLHAIKFPGLLLRRGGGDHIEPAFDILDTI